MMLDHNSERAIWGKILGENATIGNSDEKWSGLQKRLNGTFIKNLNTSTDMDPMFCESLNYSDSIMGRLTPDGEFQMRSLGN